MTQTAMKRRLAELRTATAKYTPRVEKKLASSGKTENAMAKSAAKYYVALKKLADE